MLLDPVWLVELCDVEELLVDELGVVFCATTHDPASRSTATPANFVFMPQGLRGETYALTRAISGEFRSEKQFEESS